MRAEEIITENRQLNEAAPLLWTALRALIARIGVRQFAIWLLRWLFTTAAGLTVAGILALVQLIITIVVNVAVTGTTAGAKAIYNAFKDSAGEEEADRLMKELEEKLHNTDFDVNDEDGEVDMEPLDNRELYQLATQIREEIITEADVEYSSTKPGQRMHKIGDIYGKKNVKLPTAKYIDNRNNKQKGILK